jgi:hypothetical protein
LYHVAIDFITVYKKITEVLSNLAAKIFEDPRTLLEQKTLITNHGGKGI